MNASLGRPIVSFPEGGRRRAAPPALQLQGQPAPLGAVEAGGKEQHVISSSNTGQVGSHFGHVLFHNVSCPFFF